MSRYTPLWLQQGSYAASIDRRLIGAMWPSPAVLGCAVSVSSGMTVNIAAGQVVVPTANSTGSVLCASDAVEPVTLAAAAGSGQNRYDLVICQARGNDLDGGTNNDFIFTTVTGVAAGSPVVPAVPNNAVALAQVYVPGGSAAVTAGNITDVRYPGVGQIGYTLAPASTPLTTAFIGVCGVVVQNIPANRRIKVTAQALFNKDATAGIGRLYAVDLTAPANANMNLYLPASSYCTGIVQGIFTPPAGTRSFQMQANVGAGAATILQTGNRESFLLVEDIGPVIP